MQSKQTTKDSQDDERVLELSPHRNRELSESELAVITGGLIAVRLHGITYAGGYPSDYAG